jgi:glutamate N-acetyltransferase/amino-acid N-acetyltransferase
VVEKGVGCGENAELKASEVLKLSEFTITVDLDMGAGNYTVFTSDLTLEYIKINADYRT